MARPTNEDLRKAVFSVCGQFPAAEHPWTSITAPAVLEKLGENGVSNPPSDRTIRRWIKDYAKLAEAERRLYGIVHWPQTFMASSPSLPWEAAASAFELRHLLGHRPNVLLATWYWRSRLALPGITPQRCFSMAWKAIRETLVESEFDATFEAEMTIADIEVLGKERAQITVFMGMIGMIPPDSDEDSAVDEAAYEAWLEENHPVLPREDDREGGKS